VKLEGIIHKTLKIECITLVGKGNGSAISYSISRLVYEAFNSSIPKTHIMNYTDGDNKNVNLNNL
jgi:hypothetical protein